jgi:ABC-type uncharacterized transport system permease subunit
MGFCFVLILASEALRGRCFARLLLAPGRPPGASLGGDRHDDRPVGRPLAVVGGAIRVGTPFLFVSLGECLTEKSGRINLGLEGVLVFSAMAGFGGSYLSGSPWVGVLAAGLQRRAAGALHGCCVRCRASTTSPPASR